MEIITGATILFTILLPFINAWINKVTWTPKTKSLVALGTSIILAIAYVLLTGGVANLAQLWLAIPAIYGASQAIFQFFLKNIATKFEALTTKDSAVVAPADPGTVTIATDETIKAETDSTPVPAPVQITTTPESPVEITKGNVVG
jgi:hypothetical protein